MCFSVLAQGSLTPGVYGGTDPTKIRQHQSLHKTKNSESPEMSPVGETIWDEKARLAVVKVASQCVRGGESPPCVLEGVLTLLGLMLPLRRKWAQVLSSRGMQAAAEKQNLYKFQIKLLNKVLKLRFFNARYMRHSGGENLPLIWCHSIQWKGRVMQMSYCGVHTGTMTR